MFSAKTLAFLEENHIRDSRVWFGEHKKEYRSYVLEPLRELVTALTPVMLELDGQFVVEPRVDKTICRIWRDTRFSHDPSLYRESMWVIFKRDKMHATNYPGAYFELSGDGFNYGCGFYNASTGYMSQLRSMVLAGDPDFLKAQKFFASQSLFHMEGECYKRPRYAEQPESLRQWLERRNLCFVAESTDFELLFSDQLAQKLETDFRALRPVYRFLLRVAVEEQKRQTEQSLAQR